MAEDCLYPRRVWDPVVRIIHWWMVVTVLGQLALGSVILAEDSLGVSEAGEEGLLVVHASVGYAFGAGLLARILWAFLAPGTGSWRDLLPVSRPQWRTLRVTVSHYLSGLRGEAPFYRAHNPLAGLAYAAFLAVAALQVATGATMFTGGGAVSEAWEEVHEIGFWLIGIYVIVHLVMVAVHEVTERRGLVSAMINGRKLFTAGELERHPEAQREEEIH